ncbi:hypothetical protein ACHAP8_006346 [Fusarium lateritium]
MIHRAQLASSDEASLSDSWLELSPVPAHVQAFQSITSQDVEGQPQPANNVLQEALRELWRVIPAERETVTQVIGSLSEESKAIFFHHRAQQYGDEVYQCMVPQARAIMANGSFNVEQLRTLPPSPPVGLSMLASTSSSMEVSSVNFQKRREAHQRHAVNGERSTHYTLAAKANQVRMVPIIIQDTQNVPDGFLDIAEFTVVALLGSWYATLRRPLEPNAFGSYSVDHEACQMFSRIMTVVSNRTGWNRGLTYGLNWNTPIVRHPKFDMKWTSWYDEASDCLVYRTRRTIHVRPEETNVHWHAYLADAPGASGNSVSSIQPTTSSKSWLLKWFSLPLSHGLWITRCRTSLITLCV